MSLNWKWPKTWCNCDAKGESTVNPFIITRSFKKFLLSCKSHNDQTRLDSSRIVNSKVMLEAIEINSESIRWIWHLSNLSRTAELCLTLPKYCKTFHSLKYFMSQIAFDNYHPHLRIFSLSSTSAHQQSENWQWTTLTYSSLWYTEN